MERISVVKYPGTGQGDEQFRRQSGNTEFRRSFMTWVSLIFLLVLYPAQALLAGGDLLSQLENINEGVLILMLVATIIVQWVIFLILWVTLHLERTGLAGIGVVRIQGIDVLWALTFLLAANLILAGLAWVLAQIGMPMPGEIAFLIPEDLAGRIIWVAVSFTAGFCEETAFRGYLMTRLRLIMGTRSWIVPVLISSVAFGACHAYQGWPGFIVISAYGVMFSLLYIRTGRLWPCILAHSLQDLSALFIPQ